MLSGDHIKVMMVSVISKIIWEWSIHYASLSAMFSSRYTEKRIKNCVKSTYATKAVTMKIQMEPRAPATCASNLTEATFSMLICNWLQVGMKLLTYRCNYTQIWLKSLGILINIPNQVLHVINFQFGTITHICHWFMPTWLTSWCIQAKHNSIMDRATIVSSPL